MWKGPGRGQVPSSSPGAALRILRAGDAQAVPRQGALPSSEGLGHQNPLRAVPNPGPCPAPRT